MGKNKKATPHQLANLAKGRAILARKRHGLSGIKDVLDKKKLLNTFEKAGLFLIGFVGGREIDRRFIKSGDKEGFKKFIGPILELGGGIYLASGKNEILAQIGYGLTAAGAVQGINNALGAGKDITNLETLKGLSLGEIFSGKTPIPSKIYTEPVKLQLPEAYDLDLPKLDIPNTDKPTEKEVSGAASIAEEVLPTENIL